MLELIKIYYVEVKQISRNCNAAQSFWAVCQSLPSFMVSKENSVFRKAAVKTVRMTTDRNFLIVHGLWAMLVWDTGWMGNAIQSLSLRPTSATWKN